jgi:hypothetical protein
MRYDTATETMETVEIFGHASDRDRDPAFFMALVTAVVLEAASVPGCS